jgi:putative DNA primase/helicase
MAILARGGDGDLAVRAGLARKAVAAEGRDMVVAAMRLLHANTEQGLTEVRALGVTRQGDPGKHAESIHPAPDEAGFAWAAKYALDIERRSSGVYVTLNPVQHRVSGGGFASDRHVIQRRWLCVDIDPTRPAGVSATDAEKAAALALAKTVRDHLRAQAWPEPILADSGNGHHLLYRIDLPNDDAATDLVRRCLIALAERFDRPEATIDLAMYNASRITKLYGTLARKGEPTEDRPHRRSALVEVPKHVEVVPIDWLQALAGPGPVPASPRTAPMRVVTPDDEPDVDGPDVEGLDKQAVKPRPPERRPGRRGIIARGHDEPDLVAAHAATALQLERDLVARSVPGDRNRQLFKSAAALHQLVAAGSLDGGLVDQQLGDAARSVGLDELEIATTLRSARRAGQGQPRDLSEVGKGRDGASHRSTVKDPATGVEETIDDPWRLARVYLRERWVGPDGLLTLRYWAEEWHAWREGAWRPLSDREVNAGLAATAKAAFDADGLKRGKPPRGVGSRLVGNMALLLRAQTLLPLHLVPQQPAWLPDAPGPTPDPVECLPTRSGIVHLPTLMAHGPLHAGAVLPPTPRLFTPNALSYAFDPNPPAPTAWLDFLRSVWGDDVESIECLQEMFGYLLTPDTSQQKIFLLVGPRRSGKGTIVRVLRDLVGAANVAAPTLATLAGPFGLQSLIGSSVCVCTESRLTGRADSQAIVERLLSVSGEDPQCVDRKHLTAWHGTLRARFVLLGNEVPRLGDYSSAMSGRLIVLKLTRSFFGQEDLALGQKLHDELPAILLWSLVGWARLRDRGRFHQPASAGDVLQEFEQLSNPIGAFLADRCDIGPEHRVLIPDLYAAWKTWCEASGRDHPGDVQGFGRNLRTSLPELTTHVVGAGKRFVRYYVGVRLRSVDDWTLE